LAAQIAAVNDRDVEVRREELTSFQSALMQINRPQPFHAHIPSQLPQQPFVGLEKHPFSKSKIHI
jgi:hypothetical protein